MEPRGASETYGGKIQCFVTVKSSTAAARVPGYAMKAAKAKIPHAAVSFASEKSQA